jgi:hypothetical protein
MKLNPLPLFCAIASLALVPAATAVAVNPFASVEPGTPANAASEKDYISDAVDIANGGVATRALTQTYTIIDDPAAALPVPGNVIDQGGAGNGTIDDLPAGGYYLIVKYNGRNDGSLIFLVSGISGEVTLPPNFPGSNAHANEWTLFGAAGDNGGGGPGGNPVPDGGATVAMLGLGLFGLAALRRK